MSRIESNNNLFFHNALHYISQKGEKLLWLSQIFYYNLKNADL